MTNTYPSIENIVGLVSEETGVEVQFILGESRVPRISRARQMVMFIAREQTELSFPRIARSLRRDHSTVMHGVRTIYDQSYTDDNLVESLNKIRARIRKGVRSQAAPLSIATFISKLPTPKADRLLRPVMRHRHLYHFQKPKTETLTKNRKCLGCSETFISSGPGNRLCWCCRTNANRSSLPDHYIGSVG